MPMDTGSQVGPSWLTRYLSKYTDFPVEAEVEPQPQVTGVRGLPSSQRPFSMNDLTTGIGRFFAPGLPGPVRGLVGTPEMPPDAINLADLPPLPPPPPENPAAAWLKSGPGLGFLGKQKAVQDAAAAAAARPAAPSSSTIRAVRMPGGKLVYTNRPASDPEAVQGSDVPMAGDALASRRSLGRIDPTSRTMSALVRAAAESNRGSGADVGGGLSVMESEEDQQNRSKFKTAMGAAALARAQTELEYAKMGPQGQADLANPNTGTFSFIMSQMKPEIDRINLETDAAIAKTTDPAVRATLEQKRADKIAQLYQMILAAQRVPTS